MPSFFRRKTCGRSSTEQKKKTAQRNEDFFVERRFGEILKLNSHKNSSYTPFDLSSETL